MVRTHQPLRRRARHPHPPLYQLVGAERDYRGDRNSPRIPQDLRLLVPLRRGRHRLLARRGGQLHQQDAVHLQDQQGRRVGVGLHAGQPLHPRERAARTVQPHDLRRRRHHRHPLHAPGQELRRPLHRRLQPRAEKRLPRDGVAHPGQPRQSRLPGRLHRRLRNRHHREDDHRQDRPRRPAGTARGRPLTRPRQTQTEIPEPDGK